MTTTDTTTLVIAEDIVDRLRRARVALGFVDDIPRLRGKAAGVDLAIGYLEEAMRATTPAPIADDTWTPGTPSPASQAATTPIAAYATIIAAITFRYGTDEARRLIDLAELASGAILRSVAAERDAITADAIAALIAAEATL